MQMQVNLLPAQYRPKPPVRLLPIIVAVALMANLLVLSLYWLTIHLELNRAKSDLAALQSEVNHLQRQVNDAEWKAKLLDDVRVKGDFVRSQTNQAILWYPMLEAVERAMMPDMLINTLNATADGNVAIGGEAWNVTPVAFFLSSVQQETGLEYVRFHVAEPEGIWQVTLTNWFGREIGEEGEEQDAE